MGAAISARFSVPKRSSTRVRANGKVVPDQDNDVKRRRHDSKYYDEN